MRKRALFVIVWSALSGCMSGAGVETGGESENSATSTSAATTGSSDSTDTGMPGTDEPESTTEDDPSPTYCDLDALPSVPVTWIREQPRLVVALEPTPLGLFALASEGASQPARLEAVDGTGDVLWSEPFGPPGQFVLQWDGSHLYTAKLRSSRVVTTCSCSRTCSSRTTKTRICGRAASWSPTI